MCKDRSGEFEREIGPRCRKACTRRSLRRYCSKRQLIIVVFGKREDTEAVPYFAALGSLLPPPPPGTPGPFALSGDGVLEALVTEAGMHPEKVQEFDCPWAYPDETTLLRGLLSPGPGIRAVQLSGEAAARDAVLKALAPFRTASDGYMIKNKTRYMIVKT